MFENNENTAMSAAILSLAVGVCDIMHKAGCISHHEPTFSSLYKEWTNMTTFLEVTSSGGGGGDVTLCFVLNNTYVLGDVVV